MPTLEFTLDPADVPLLARRSGLRGGRSFPIDLTWHDTADGALAADGLALCASPAGWQLARLVPGGPAAPPAVLADASRLDLLNHDLPDDLIAVARITGQRRTFRPAPDRATHQGVEVRLLDAVIAGPRRQRACRVTLAGPAPLLAPIAATLAQEMGMRVPLAGLAQTARLATGTGAAPSRPPAAAQVSHDQTVSDSLATIAGGLLMVMTHWAELAPTAQSPEPVHQMRVATRRLRSALSVYRDVAACPEVAALIEPLKHCAASLGGARDWDVFIGGTGARLAQALPDDLRCAGLLRAAGRRRSAAYADLQQHLHGPAFRTLTVGLACAVTLRPWDAAMPGDALQQPATLFAAAVLARRLKRVKTAARGLDTLSLPALHELRKDCKKLRYAAEFFSPLFPQKPGKKFLARLADLQEELGLLNDAAAISGLMAQLGRLERSYAAGLVEGFSAAHAEPARGRISAAWKRFRAADAFWID